MNKVIGSFFIFVLTSLYLFPFELKGIPGINTKMMLAAVGLCVYLIRLAKGQSGGFNRDTFLLSVYAAVFSLVSFAAVTYNGTPDYAFVFYIVSMWVWIGAAYFMINCMRAVHGFASVRLVIYYLAAVCVFQCVMALWIDSSESVKRLVDTYIEQGQNFLNQRNVERLYGSGASLGVAGSRFSAVLALLAFLLVHLESNHEKTRLFLYLSAFVVIAVVGNIIARTTTVGLVVGILYLVYGTRLYTLHLRAAHKHLWITMGLLLLVAIPLLSYLYTNDPVFHKHLRFGFEGFFSLVEEGEWTVSSNERLQTMYVFPESLKTWIIGDGYFSNSRDVDPYFTGRYIGGYYMGTDVGYLRFIFYAGVLGLAAMTSVICKAFQIGWKRFPRQREVFLLLLLLNLIIWLKVSTELFMVFALFLMIDKEEDEAYGQRVHPYENQEITK